MERRGEKTKLLWQNPEYRKHMMLVHKGQKPVNLEQLAKHAKSEGHRKWLSETRKGKSSWNKGLTAVQMSVFKGVERPNLSGKNHYKWIEDRTLLKDDHRDRGGALSREWSKQVKKRDNWKCKINNCDCKGRLESHHILGWTEHPELRYEINNGITLCHAHHPRKREQEAKLSPYFKTLVAEMK